MEQAVQQRQADISIPLSFACSVDFCDAVMSCLTIIQSFSVTLFFKPRGEKLNSIRKYHAASMNSSWSLRQLPRGKTFLFLMKLSSWEEVHIQGPLMLSPKVQDPWPPSHVAISNVHCALQGGSKVQVKWEENTLPGVRQPSISTCDGHCLDGAGKAGAMLRATGHTRILEALLLSCFSD